MSNTLSKKSNAASYRIAFAALSCVILIVPLVAMQLTSEVDWTFGDFAVAAFLLLTLGAMIELAVRFITSHALRATVVGIALAGFVFVWAMLAVG